MIPPSSLCSAGPARPLVLPPPNAIVEEIDVQAEAITKRAQSSVAFIFLNYCCTTRTRFGAVIYHQVLLAIV